MREEVGLFISLEGGEGSGKTVQASQLVQQLRESGYNVILVQEPGTTKLGQFLRDWLKSNRPTSPRAELFLFAAARSELVTTIINPSLSLANTVIVADRYADSTTAYQGYGRKLKLEGVKVVNELATHSIWPHLTILLDIEPELGLSRLGTTQQRHLSLEGSERRLDDVGQRRFEKESLTFHRRIRKGYLKMARAEPDRWFVVNSSQATTEVATLIWERVSTLLRQKTPQAESPLGWKT